MISPRKKEKRICQRCNKRFYPLYTSKGLYCSCKCSNGCGKNHKMWKGDNVTYQGIHSWFRNKKKTKCDFCKTTEKLELALKKGKEYSRNIKNYFTLCVKCHRKYDAHTAWNKGLRTKDNIICRYCKREFYPNRKNTKFCSNKCSAKARPAPIRQRNKQGHFMVRIK